MDILATLLLGQFIVSDNIPITDNLLLLDKAVKFMKVVANNSLSIM